MPFARFDPEVARDNTIYIQNIHGEFVRTGNSIRSTRDHANFVITCAYGDWSGYLTLVECERRFDELKKYFKESSGGRAFAIVER